MVSSIEVIDYFYKIRAGNYAVYVTNHTFYTIVTKLNSTVINAPPKYHIYYL